MSDCPTYSRRAFLRRAGQSVVGLSLVAGGAHRIYGSLLDPTPYIERSFFTMGTVVTMSAYGESRALINNAITKAYDELKRLDGVMSLYKPESSLCAINNAAGRQTLRVGRDLFDVIVSSRRFSEVTAGAFDITIEPLMRLWGFRSNEPRASHLPSDRDIAHAAEAVGFHNVVFNSNEGTLGLVSPLSKIDLGGIGVGYAVDRVVNILKAEGITAAFINHSGDAYALGTPPGMEGWLVAVSNPLQPRETATSFSIRDRAVSTSGTYEKFVEIGRRRFSHIIHPRTGNPCEAPLSLTVLAPSALEADALSTGLSCMDYAERRERVQDIQNIEVLDIQPKDEELELRRYAGSADGL